MTALYGFENGMDDDAGLVRLYHASNGNELMRCGVYSASIPDATRKLR